MGFDDNSNRQSRNTSLKQTKNKSQMLNFSPWSTDNEIMIEVNDSFLNYNEPKFITRNLLPNNSNLGLKQRLMDKREMIPTSSFVFNDMIRSKSCYELNKDVKEFLNKSNVLHII